jgi:hypothetical protein
MRFATLGKSGTLEPQSKTLARLMNVLDRWWDE